MKITVKHLLIISLHILGVYLVLTHMPQNANTYSGWELVLVILAVLSLIVFSIEVMAIIAVIVMRISKWYSDSEIDIFNKGITINWPKKKEPVSGLILKQTSLSATYLARQAPPPPRIKPKIVYTHKFTSEQMFWLNEIQDSCTPFWKDKIDKYRENRIIGYTDLDKAELQALAEGVKIANKHFKKMKKELPESPKEIK